MSSWKRFPKLPAGITLLFCGVCIGSIALDFAIYILVTYEVAVTRPYLFSLLVILLLALGFFFNQLPHEETFSLDGSQQTLDKYFQGEGQ
jgi:hypothetical protein